MASPFSLLLLFLFILASIHVEGDRIMLEDGYMVTTVMDGHKLKVNPHAVQLKSSDLVVLDSSKSVFYTLPFPISQDGLVAKQLSGSGVKGYSDGESGSTMFNKPKSFAVDHKGNIYVADQQNLAIRKISSSGVTTTIAGNHSRQGRQDGPGKSATFSTNFEVVFVPQICALLISDHGNQLLRQIDLKPEDCTGGSRSGLGTVATWGLVLGLSCFASLIIGIFIRPYVIPHEGSSPFHFSRTWSLFLINLVNLILMICFAIRSAVASSSPFTLSERLVRLSLSHLSLMFRINTVGSKVSNKDSVSLVDSDVNSCALGKSRSSADQLGDLIDFDNYSQVSNLEGNSLKQGVQERHDVSLNACGRIDYMIQANIAGFGKPSEETTPVDVPLVRSLGLVKRR